MKDLFYWLDSLGRPASILYTRAHLAAFNKITLSIISLGSLCFLVNGLALKEGVRSREQRLMSLTGLSGLLYAGLALLWYFDVRFVQSRAVAIGYYFAWHLVGGIALGLFLFLGFPKAARTLLTMSATLFVAFNVFVIVRHLASATLFLCMVNSLVIGVLIPSAFALGFDQRKKAHQSGNRTSAISAATGGMQKDA